MADPPYGLRAGARKTGSRRAAADELEAEPTPAELQRTVGQQSARQARLASCARAATIMSRG